MGSRLTSTASKPSLRNRKVRRAVVPSATRSPPETSHTPYEVPLVAGSLFVPGARARRDRCIRYRGAPPPGRGVGWSARDGSSRRSKLAARPRVGPAPAAGSAPSPGCLRAAVERRPVLSVLRAGHFGTLRRHAFSGFAPMSVAAFVAAPGAKPTHLPAPPAAGSASGRA